jgi:hypothetical protein
MAVGDVTATVVGTYLSLTLAIAAINGGNLPAATDYYQIFQQNGVGSNTWQVIKIVRATA